ncbi:MAG TPA: rhomboid family intramembrane serine protease [Cytophagaceae bacterium]|jgi:membrane associated rhomboid family serine protease|nr:rhomboid family intramembrane serine protease [Cytophagaceae bacterium]
MNLLDEIKWELKKRDNALVKLILINILVFVIMGIIHVVSLLSGNTIVMDFVDNFVSLPSSFWEFIYKPWTIITYAFVHSLQDIFHILFNMLNLYWFGRIVADLVGSKKLISLYVLGGISAGVVYLLMFNIGVDYLNIPKGHSSLIGASGAVYAIIVGAATLSPGYIVNLFFTWQVKIVYIAAAVIFISFLGTVGGNAGGNFAHLGGALFGYIFIKQLQRGNDLGKPFYLFTDWVSKLFKKRSPIKVSYRNTTGSASGNTSVSPDQKEIDDILDKISRSGYESLSKEEKQKLFKASQK